MPNPHSLPLLAAALAGLAFLAALGFAWLRFRDRLPSWARWGAAAFWALIGLAYLLVVYAALIEPETLVVRRVEIVSENWHGAPLTIAAIGDTHVGGPHMDAARMARVVRRINALHPDLVVLLGDYAYGHEPETSRTPAARQEIIGALATAAAFDARYGVVAVLGNHDGWYGRQSITTALQNAGAAALWNRNIVIHRSGGEIVVAGLADAWTGHPDFAEALDGAPPGDDTIVLSHNPDPFAQMPPGIALMLAAHTHCGQVTIPFIGRPFLPIHHKEYACHLVEQRGEALYVTAGVGTSIAPVRFLNPPEISLITVRGVRAR
jgi:hypothetical protein